MKSLKIIQQIYKEKIIAVIRTNTQGEALRAAEAAYDGGIRLIEITMTTPGALQIILELKEKYGETVTVGVGTVIDEASAQLAINHGADFIVCPHIDPNIIEICHLYQIPVVPGASTTTEIILALKHGCSIIKLFPANILGAKAIRSFKGPLPQANFIPTGGVNADNIKEWLESGAVAVGTGGELTKEALKTGDFTSVTEYGRCLVERVKEFELGRKLSKDS